MGCQHVYSFGVALAPTQRLALNPKRAESGAFAELSLRSSAASKTQSWPFVKRANWRRSANTSQMRS